MTCAEHAAATDAAAFPHLAAAPRLAGVVVALVGVGIIAINRAVIASTGRTYLILFPLGGMFLGFGAAVVLTGRVVLDGPTIPTGTRIVAYTCIGLGTLLGIALNFTG